MRLVKFWAIVLIISGTCSNKQTDAMLDLLIDNAYLQNLAKGGLGLVPHRFYDKVFFSMTLKLRVSIVRLSQFLGS